MTYDAELKDARRMDREHPNQDGSMSYEEALYWCRVELEHCRCPRDADGEPSPYNVNDLCEYHSGIVERAIESGRFWDPNDAWPWGEVAHPARQLAARPAPPSPPRRRSNHNQ